MTLLWVPKELVITEGHFGSVTHEPSTKNLYSCLPGFKPTLISQLPLASFLPESAFASQLLKLPARPTVFALGAYSLNTVAFALLNTVVLTITTSLLYPIYTQQLMLVKKFYLRRYYTNALLIG